MSRLLWLRSLRQLHAKSRHKQRSRHFASHANDSTTVRIWYVQGLTATYMHTITGRAFHSLSQPNTDLPPFASGFSFGSGASLFGNVNEYVCPYCALSGLTETPFIEHVLSAHANDPKPVVCLQHHTATHTHITTPQITTFMSVRTSLHVNTHTRFVACSLSLFHA